METKIEKLLIGLEKEIDRNRKDLAFLCNLRDNLKEKCKTLDSFISINVYSKKYLGYLSDKKIENKKVQNIFKNFNFESFTYEDNGHWQHFEIVLNNNGTNKLLASRTYTKTIYRADSMGAQYNSSAVYDIKYGDYSLKINYFYKDEQLKELCEKLQLDHNESKEFIEIFKEMVITCYWYKWHGGGDD